jgi:hypothetical protein
MASVDMWSRRAETVPRKSFHRKSPAIDIAGLSAMPIDGLRQLWTGQFGVEPLPRVSRELLVRGVAYRLQEERIGGLLPNEQRKLARLGAELERSGSLSLAASMGTRPGTRLVREWQGELHEVIVLDGYYLWKGHRYRSLSEIARRITGTRWSGPRFFGLNGSAPGTDSNASENRHA